jgi:PAS domain S-box-containing protein
MSDPTSVDLISDLGHVVITEELAQRRGRRPDYELERQALSALVEELAASPSTVLQRLCDLLVELGLAQTAGVSLHEPDDRRLRWVAVAGQWAPHLGGVMPFGGSPCGAVMTRNEPMLFARPHEHFPAANVEPLIREILLVPFRSGDTPVGTLWVMAHDEAKRFDAEDLRLLTSLAHFASAAYRTTRAFAEAEADRSELQASRDLLQATMDASTDMIQVFAAVRDASGEIVDFTWVLNNHTSQGKYGEVEGESLLTRNPGVVQEGIFDAFKRVTETGTPEQAERHYAHEQFNGWFYQSVVKLNDGVATTTKDITDWKRAQDILRLQEEVVQSKLRESEDRQAFLLRLGDQLRAEPDADAIASRALRMLLDRLELDRCYIGIYRLADDLADFPYQVAAEGLAPIPSQVRLSHFPESLRLATDQTLVVEDGETMVGLSDADRASIIGLGFRAFVAASLHVGERRPLWAIVAVSTQPRQWTKNEVALIEAVTERTWTAMERARAEQALRESEERQAFLLSLGDAMRTETDAESLVAVAARMLGERLGASRILFAQFDHERGVADIFNGWFANGAQPFPSVMRLEEFEGPILDELRAGRTVRVEDTAAPTPARADFAAIGKLGVAALLSVPLIVAGRLVVNLSAHQHTARCWTDAEVALAEEVAERLWADLVRVRAQAGLRDSEARLRNALSISTVAVLFWGPDFRLTQVNDAFLHITGFTKDEAIGKTWQELTPAEFFPASEHAVREVTERGEATPYEKQYYRKDGTRWWGLFAPRRLSDGEVVEFVVDIGERRQAEEAQRQSEARFREFGENSSDALWIIDADTMRLEYLSPAYERIWGESRDIVLADIGRWAEMIHPDDRAEAAEAMPRLLAGQAFVTEYRIIRADGEVRWIRDAGFPIKEEGVVTRGGGIAQDVTDLKRAETAVRESEARLREFGEASQDILWIRDAEGLQWQYLTPAFETIYGLSREEALAGNNYRSWLELVVPEDRARVMENMRRVRAGEQVAFEYRIRRPADGELRWLRNTDFPIRDENGEVRLIGGIGHDLTELRGTELRLKALVEGIPQLVWRAGEPGLWTWASPQWTEFTGQSEVDSRGWGWLELLHPEDRETARDAWARAVERGLFEAEYRICAHEAGTYRWFQTRAAPVRDETGEIIEWLGTSTDIHELRELQARQDVMVAELQHRTRNLITVVRAVSRQTLKNVATLTDFERAFGDRLSALSRVQGLLSHLSAGERVTFEELLRSELAALGAPEDRVKLEGPGDVPLRSATVQTFSLALHELATNALKYGALASPEGHLTVRWDVTMVDGGEPMLAVDWRESGVNMIEVGEKPAGGGYGRELIERALPYQLSAKTTYELTPDGVHCTIDVPISASRE